MIVKSQMLRFILAVVISGLIGYGIGVTKVDWEWKNYRPHVENEIKPSVAYAF